MSGLETGMLVMLWLIVLMFVKTTTHSIVTIAIIGLFHHPIMIALIVKVVVYSMYNKEGI